MLVVKLRYSSTNHFTAREQCKSKNSHRKYHRAKMLKVEPQTLCMIGPSINLSLNVKKLFVRMNNIT